MIALAIGMALLPGPAFGQQVCVDNSYAEIPAGATGQLVVTEAAITYAKSNCPASAARLGRGIQLRAGQSLFFWFRLQGDTDYLSTPQIRYPLVLNFFRDNGSVYVDQGLLEMGRIDRSAMAAEAAGAGGKFDWRLGAEKWRFDIPGNYKIVLSQQGNEVRCLSPSLFSQCSLTVEVLP